MTAHTARRAGSLSMVAQRPAQAHRLRTDKMDICKATSHVINSEADSMQLARQLAPTQTRSTD